MNDDPNFKPPAKSTMHLEIVTLRQVLKTAVRHGWLHGMHDLSEPYRKVQKVAHLAWFSPEEYKQLYTATRANISYEQHNQSHKRTRATFNQTALISRFYDNGHADHHAHTQLLTNIPLPQGDGFP